MESRMQAYMSALFTKTKHKPEVELQHRLRVDFRPDRYISVGVVQSPRRIPCTQNVRDVRKCHDPWQKATRTARCINDGEELKMRGILRQV